MPAASISKTFTAAATQSGSLQVSPGMLYTLLITGTFVATLQLEYSSDGGQNWNVLKSFTAAQAASILVSGGTLNRSYRFNCVSFTSGVPIVTLSRTEATLLEIDAPSGAAALKVVESGISAPTFVGAPAGLTVQDPGQIAVNSLRVASDVVSAQTVTIGGDVYEVEIVNTDSTDTCLAGAWTNTAQISVLAATYPHLSTTLGSLIRIQSEILRLIGYDGTTLTYSRGDSGTTAATHANAQVIYKGDGVTTGNIAVGLVTTLTPTAFTAALLAVINGIGTELVTAVLVSVNEIFLKARSVGAVALATTETLAGANNAWAATAMYGGKAAAARKINFQSRVPLAMDVTLGGMKFQFDFTPTLVQVYIVVTATPGIALAWDGGFTITDGLVVLDNAGTTDWAVTNTVYVIAQA